MGLVVERNDSASCTRMDSRRSKCCRSDTMNAVDRNPQVDRCCLFVGYIL